LGLLLGLCFFILQGSSISISSSIQKKQLAPSSLAFSPGGGGHMASSLFIEMQTWLSCYAAATEDASLGKGGGVPCHGMSFDALGVSDMLTPLLLQDDFKMVSAFTKLLVAEAV
jgi:hypothetical protein